MCFAWQEEEELYREAVQHGVWQNTSQRPVHYLKA